MKHALLISALLLAACGPQKPAPYQSFGTTKGPGSVGVHTVTSGDTLYKISKNYRLPMREIITVNQLSPPYRLHAGYRMQLPPPNDYKVREGDTVYSIARMHDLSVNQLVRINNLRSPYVLQTGQVLRFPSAIQPPKPAARPAYVEPQVAQNTAPSSSGAVTPSSKPTYKKASVTPRAKIPKSTPKMAGNGQFMRPVNGQIISTYGPKSGGLYNDGINIKAVRGSPVRAAQNGVVVYTGDDLEGYGNLVLVRHQNRMMTAYAHLEKTLVKRGDTVKRGQSLATVGSSGQVDSPQLHFEVRRGSKALDPSKYL